MPGVGSRRKSGWGKGETKKRQGLRGGAVRLRRGKGGGGDEKGEYEEEKREGKSGE